MNKPLVYILDDSADFNLILERRFIRYGCNVLSFTEPDALIAAFRREEPQMVLVDLKLADSVSGADVVKLLRGEFNLKIPIIMISGNNDEENIFEAFEMGATDYIVKPPLRYDFEEVIANYLKSEFLPEPTRERFRMTLRDKGRLTLVFPSVIHSVHPTGFCLISDHLIYKDLSFTLSGPELAKIVPGFDRVRVTVQTSEIKEFGGEKRYLVYVSVDPYQEAVLAGIGEFLKSKTQELEGIAVEAAGDGSTPA